MTDNITTPIPGSTKFKTKDTGANGHLPGHVLYDSAEAEALGLVTASPAANTILGRLKDLLSLIVLAAGTNVIGKVGIDQTTPGTTNAVSATNAGTFAVQAAQDTSKIANGATALTPKFALISVSSSGVNIIVAAVTSKKIRVLAWDLSPNAAVNAKWQSHTAGDKTGLYYMAGQGNGNARSFNPVGWFETAAGESLDLNLSAAVAVGGCITYVEV
jgi:hypothetical protein